MAKNYFHDILEPDAEHSSGGGKNESESRTETRSGERSIRNITVHPRAPRPRAMSGDMRETSPGSSHAPREKLRLNGQKRIWIWVVAAVSVVILLVLALFAFRSTTITVTPRSRAIVFDQTVRFTASPSASTAGTLSYTVIANDLEDSAVVPSNGTVHAEDAASGKITVFNDYSPSPVRLIKNTRFETPSGLIFRVPATVVIPGKVGSTPGSVAVTVIADRAGEQYNIGPVDKFTLPGLKTTPDMYARVYARSTSVFIGGFVGDKPGVAPGALESAKAEVRGRLETKARDGARALTNTTATVFPDLIRITYESLPATTEAGGGVRIHEKARVEIPVLPAAIFAQTVAQGVGENTEGVSFSIDGLNTLVAEGGSADATQTILGTDPIDFTLTGSALLIWNVDPASLSQALTGRDQSAFQGIINGFPSIQEARARIEPFWKKTFPTSPSDIKIQLVTLQATR